MSRFLTTKLLNSLLVTLVVVAGCGKDESAPATSSSLVSDNSILQYIPADTPYVFAAVEPMPDDLMDKIEPRLDEIMQSYQVVLREVVAMKRAESGFQDSMDPDQVEKVDAFVEELTGLLSIDGIRGAGIERGGAMAFYGNGLLPVLRFELGDSALFDAAITRLEEQAQFSLPVAAIEGGGYRYIDGDDMRFIIAILENQAVITLVPAGLDDEGIASALGLSFPETSIARSGALQDIAGHYGFTSHLLGFIDLQAIAVALISPQGINAQLMSVADGGPAELSDVCKAEIGEMVGIMPRIVVGYDEINADRMSSTVAMELRDDLASELSRLTAPVPGLGIDPGGLMAFGLSLDIQQARGFAEARIAAMEADPYECELFAEMQAGTAGVEQALARPVPPIVNDFKGFFAVVEELEGLDLETQTPPSSVTGRFLLALDNAPTLVAMGAMFSPEIAGLNLQPDGKPVPLVLSQLQAMGMTAFAALNDSALAIAVGDDPEDDLSAMLGAEVGDNRPFMSFSMDSARYYAFIGDAIATAETEDGETAPSPEMQAALRDIMNSVGSLYERMAVNVYFTANGIEFRSVQDIAD